VSETISTKNIPPDMIWDTCHELFKLAPNMQFNNPNDAAINPVTSLLIQSGPESLANYLRASHELEARNIYSPAWSGIRFDDGKPSGIVTVSPDQDVILGRSSSISGAIVDVVSLGSDPQIENELLDDGLDIAELYFPGQVALTIVGICKLKEKQIKLSVENLNKTAKIPQSTEDKLFHPRFSEVVFVGGIKRRILERSMRIRRRAAILSNAQISV
jgi:hypothetical protein